MIRAGILLFIVLLQASLLCAQDNTPKYSNEFLSIGVDARAFGMGLSMTAHTSDASSSYWNPAGLVRLKPDYQLELMHSAYYAGISNYDYGAFAARIDEQSAISVSVIRFAVDDIADTRYLFDANGSVNYDNIQYFSAADYAFLVGYGRELPVLGGIQVGGNVKVIRRVVGDFANSWGFGMDLGAQKQINNWSLGVVIKDVFGTFNSWSISDEELAETYATTGNDLYSQSLEITLPRIVTGAAYNWKFAESFNLLSSLDLVTTTDGKRNTLIRTDVISVDPAFGFELGYKSLAFLRGGIGQFQQIKDYEADYTWTFQPNAGVGFKIQEVSIDYAFTDIGDQAAGLYSHVFSIKVDFNVD